MQLLLDTQLLLWWVNADRKLTKKTREVISHRDNRVIVSAATFWEISIKQMLGRITIDLAELRDAVVADGFDELQVAIQHTLQLTALPPRHHDPFDRLLIAQAISEGCVLVTRDRAIHEYAGVANLMLFEG